MEARRHGQETNSRRQEQEELRASVFPWPVLPSLVPLTDEEAAGLGSNNWAVSGAHTAAAAFDVARTVCRRAERGVVRLVETGETVQPNIVPYLNRLSDLLWLIGRKLEKDAGVSGSPSHCSGDM